MRIARVFACARRKNSVAHSTLPVSAVARLKLREVAAAAEQRTCVVSAILHREELARRGYEEDSHVQKECNRVRRSVVENLRKALVQGPFHSTL